MISFKKNESFYIREGWISKAINAIYDNPKTNIFSKNSGVMYLGMGSNMVKGLKYWLSAANIISGKENKLSSFGNLLQKYDQYLEQSFSWFLIHYNLVKNYKECPIFNIVFTDDQKSFDKDSMEEYISNFLKEKENCSTISAKYIEADFNIFIHSYYSEDRQTNPEDNYICPLADLRLLKKERDKYTKTSPSFTLLSPLIVFYSLENLYPNQDSFLIEDAMSMKESPCKLFCLEKMKFLQYLDSLQSLGLIRINKTAGLNAVYFNKRLKLNDVFELERKLFGHV